MWKIYMPSGAGIAIRSDYGRLTNCFLEPNVKDTPIYTKKVKYIDYQRETINAQNILNPVIHKRKNFEYENEIRAYSPLYPNNKIPKIPLSKLPESEWNENGSVAKN
jgi:hypothetical protein